jgi:hypothetical protein
MKIILVKKGNTKIVRGQCGDIADGGGLNHGRQQ